MGGPPIAWFHSSGQATLVLPCFLLLYFFFSAFQEWEIVGIGLDDYAQLDAFVVTDFSEVVTAIVQTFKTLDEYSQQLAKGPPLKM